MLDIRLVTSRLPEPLIVYGIASDGTSNGQGSLAGSSAKSTSDKISEVNKVGRHSNFWPNFSEIDSVNVSVRSISWTNR